MKGKLNNIFHKDKNIIIGAIHLPPLSGYPAFPGLDLALANALADLKAFEQGGVDGIFVENNYDIPHKAFVDKEVADDLSFLTQKIKVATALPVGISVLWNDYRTALKISKELGLTFIRVPVFVDKVETQYGIMEPQADNVISFQKEIHAEEVALFVDIHVKHSKILSPYTLEQSAVLAREKGADATGKWTGEVPEVEHIARVRQVVGDFPILCGSGIDSDNIPTLFGVTNGAIVSTSLKEGATENSEVNLKPYNLRISGKKVKDLVNKIR